MLRSVAAALVVVLALATAPRPCEAQCSPDWLPGSGLPGANGKVNCMVQLPSEFGGDVIVGGEFTAIGDVAANYIARYNPSTGVWSALGTGISFSPDGDRSVNALLVLPDGDVIVGGAFGLVQDYRIRSVARYNPATNSWSRLNLDIGVVATMALHPSGDLFLGGCFYQQGSSPGYNTLIRYNFATSVAAQSAAGIDGCVSALTITAGGLVLVGGSFDNVGAVNSPSVASYDPATDQWSTLGRGLTVNGFFGRSPGSMGVLSNGDIVAVGSFYASGNLRLDHIARYSFETNTWSPLGPEGNPITSSLATRSVQVLPNNDLLLAGYSFSSGMQTGGSIVRYNPTTGTLFDYSAAASVQVNSVLPLANGGLMAGGQFGGIGLSRASNIGRYTPQTHTWAATVEVGLNSNVSTLAAMPNGDLLVGGAFTNVGSIPAHLLARYSPASNSWSGLGSGFSHPYFASVKVVLALPNGDVIVGGQFTAASGVPANAVARYSAATGAWSALGSGIGSEDSNVSALALHPSGDIIVGGYFDTAGGVATSNIARFNPRTNTWSTMGAGVGSVVGAIAITASGDIFQASSVSIYNTVVQDRFSRYNAATNTWIDLGAKIKGSVYAMAVLPDGDVIMGGGFSSFDPAITLTRAARYKPTTGTWSSLGSGIRDDGFFQSTRVNALAVLAGGDVILVGTFDNAGGLQGLGGVARWHPATGEWSSLGAGLDSPARAVTVLPIPGGEMLAIGGSFARAGGIRSAYFAQCVLSPCACSPADIAGAGFTGARPDGILDGLDFTAFINAFATGDPAADSQADIAGAGEDGLAPDGVIDGSDFIAFINAYAAGC